MTNSTEELMDNVIEYLENDGSNKEMDFVNAILDLILTGIEDFNMRKLLSDYHQYFLDSEFTIVIKSGTDEVGIIYTGEHEYVQAPYFSHLRNFIEDDILDYYYNDGDLSTICYFYDAVFGDENKLVGVFLDYIPGNSVE